MKHPTREEWMSYLYDELPSATRTDLRRHLEACAECRTQMEVWQSATREMSDWKLPGKRRIATAPTLLRWAIAAAVIGLAVVGSVRVVALKNVKQLRAEMRQQLIDELRRDVASMLAEGAEQTTKSASAEAQALIAAVAEKWEEKRLTDQQATLAALQQLNAQRVADYAAMRKELETVAVFTETGLQRAENQIATLAYSPASFSENK